MPSDPDKQPNSPRDDSDIPPMAELPPTDFWEALYSRRSIRKFDTRPVDRELIDQVMHAGIWAPSSCNYQMWDLVAVDDPELNLQLAQQSTQMGNAPVNIVVTYGRGFSEENAANVQSASALVQNMSLAAHALGLGTFWITQFGDAREVQRILSLPADRMLIAVLALGYAKTTPKRGPKRRPLSQVAHYNHYAGRPTPSSVDPEDWEPDLLAAFQRARVMNGLRHNKPRAWEVRALGECLDHLLPDGCEKVGEGEAPRWLDVLPCTGILTEKVSRLRPGFRFDVVERTSDVATFAAGRLRPKGGMHAWPTVNGELSAPARGTYDVISCFYRLEGLGQEQRGQLMADLQTWLAPGGRLLLGFISSRSFHDWTERIRARRGGPGGVEYVLSPDPNIGPFHTLSPRSVEQLATDAGFQIEQRLGLQAAPQKEEVLFRARNFSRRSRSIAGFMGTILQALECAPGLCARYGRFQYLLLRKAQD